MANLQAAKKSIRSDTKKQIFNLRRRRALRMQVKEVRDAVVAGDSALALKALPSAYKAIDKAAKGGVIKKNTAARKKSRLAASIKKIQKK
jgi:small subunit ribosomal protein S20